MKEFIVEFPALLKISTIVKAETKEEAINKAVENCDLQLKSSSDLDYEIDEWDVYKIIAEGNFYRGHINEADAHENDY